MSHLRILPDWHINDKCITPEASYQKRRAFIRKLGLGTAGISLGAGPLSMLGAEANAKDTKVSSLGYPFERNNDFNPSWKLTQQTVAESYNNFYEFTTNKSRVRYMVGAFNISPWDIQIGGLVENPVTLPLEDCYKRFQMEERVYRFRCVEAWSMVVPWTGFPLSALLKWVQPKPEARFVKFTTFNRPNEAPGMRLGSYPWPYVEGLTIEEAEHPLTFVATGIYGKPLPKQNGAPVRLVVPWKYGYKSIKSIDRIEFTAQQPKTFWESLSPVEYPFESNVNPNVPHPRWSQATERVVDTGLRRRTELYNGYGAQVGRLY
ncbi:MAG: protein-methionine-sulfoxide reductase catalytic subunit MsrP [Limisphaerales bacterium]